MRQVSSSSPRPYEQAFSVSFTYPVVFTRGVFQPENRTLAGVMARDEGGGPCKALVFLDQGLVAARPELPDEVEAWFGAHPASAELAGRPVNFPGGERAKGDLTTVTEIVRLAARHRLCRHSFIVAVGGGALLDAVGLAAALFHRGMRLIRLPSTVLAQNDAGVGVKNGINLDGIKNGLGTFAPPFAVVNDLDFLHSLPEIDWIGGVAEAFKVAIIQDEDFFSFLCANAGALRRRDEEAMEETVRRCAALHLRHIALSGDPFEFGRARPLDFGHWAAHRLEVMSGHRIRHGQAVAAGIALDSTYANLMGWLDDAELEAIRHGLEEVGFPLFYPEFERREEGVRCLWRGLEEFREHLGGQLTVTFPLGIGASQERHEVREDVLERALQLLAERAGKR